VCVHIFLCCGVLCRWRPCVGPIPRPRILTNCLRGYDGYDEVFSGYQPAQMVSRLAP
jgi:hypothetical protein